MHRYTFLVYVLKLPYFKCMMFFVISILPWIYRLLIKLHTKRYKNITIVIRNVIFFLMRNIFKRIVSRFIYFMEKTRTMYIILCQIARKIYFFKILAYSVI